MRYREETGDERMKNDRKKERGNTLSINQAASS